MRSKQVIHFFGLSVLPRNEIDEQQHDAISFNLFDCLCVLFSFLRLLLSVACTPTIWQQMAIYLLLFQKSNEKKNERNRNKNKKEEKKEMPTESETKTKKN